MGVHNIIFKNCKVCNKPIDDTFYDKSKYRPLCSKECYGKYIDNLPKRYEKTRAHDKGTRFNEPVYDYYKRGRLVLANYNLNIW
jgi:hypothetical protein